MLNFLIQYEEPQTICELEKYGDIFYRSTIMKIVGLKTSTHRTHLLKIKGVISVEKDRRCRQNVL